MGDDAAGGTAGRRVVLVTGGSRGIGLACARRFQAGGDRVAVTWKTKPPEVLEGPPGTHRLLPVGCDVTSPGAVERAFAEVEEVLGPVQVLVCAAGITDDTLLLRMSEERWDNVIQTNLTSVYRTAKRALGPMVRARQGRIVLISSVVAFMGSAGQVNYGASKAALVGFARSLAREVASRSITVNVVAPGATEVQERTRDVLIEAADFDPVSIRTTARQLGLHSDSSYRFERRVDAEGIDWASRRCAELILEIAGG
ncbi:MAG: SDR family NAD(P)-dependent oxidoreductase, partial [Acidimicrobiales bacterium]